MNKISELIVVEGKTDIDFLSTFIDADFYAVGGSAVSEKDVEFLRKIKENRDIIILTDPDFPGEKIRSYLNSQIDGLKNAFVRKEVSIKKGKVGVAESTKEEIESALKSLISWKKVDFNGVFTQNDLYLMGFYGQVNSSELRKKVCDKYHLGHSNGKMFLKKINLLKLTKEDLMEAKNA